MASPAVASASIQEGTMQLITKGILVSAAFMLLALPAVAQTPSTLEVVKKRGQVVCGVNVGLGGFSLPDSQGKRKGLDVDMCGEVAVLVRNSTVTLELDGGLGIQYTGINFFDGQGFMVPKKSNVKALTELGGATICVAQGTTHEFNMAGYFRSRNLS